MILYMLTYDSYIMIMDKIMSNLVLLIFTNCVMALYGGIYSGMKPEMVQYQKRKKLLYKYKILRV